MGIGGLQDVIVGPVAGANIAEGIEPPNIRVQEAWIGAPPSSPVDDSNQLSASQGIICLLYTSDAADE